MKLHNLTEHNDNTTLIQKLMFLLSIYFSTVTYFNEVKHKCKKLFRNQLNIIKHMQLHLACLQEHFKAFCKISKKKNYEQLSIKYFLDD